MKIVAIFSSSFLGIYFCWNELLCVSYFGNLIRSWWMLHQRILLWKLYKIVINISSVMRMCLLMRENTFVESFQVNSTNTNQVTSHKKEKATTVPLMVEVAKDPFFCGALQLISFSRGPIPHTSILIESQK